MKQRFECYLPALDAYHRRVRGGPCFVCALMAEDSEVSGNHVVYQDELVIAFLAQSPTQYGHTLVCP
jgi:hypothetical protein